MQVVHDPYPRVVYDNKAERQFIEATKRIEKGFARCAAWVIIDPRDPARSWFKVRILYPRDGAGKLQAVAWLPGGKAGSRRHYGWANGYGHDKASAAMSGASFLDVNGVEMRLKDDGKEWHHQIEDAGYIVIRAA